MQFLQSTFLLFIFTAAFNVAMANEVPETQGSESYNIDELIVLGSRLDLQRKQMGSNISILTKADIQNMGAAYVADALRHLPGVSVGRTGAAGGLTQVRIRGSEANHVLVIIDGVEANSVNGEFDFANLTTANIERIELLRGAQSGVYGSNATAGVINIATQQNAEQFTTQVGVEAGTYGWQRQTVNVNGGGNKLNGGLSINHQRFAYNAAPEGGEEDLDRNFQSSLHGQWQINESFSLSAQNRYLKRQFDVDDQVNGVAVDTPSRGDSKELATLIGAQYSPNANWQSDIKIDKAKFENGGRDGFGVFGNKSYRSKIAAQSRWGFDSVGRLQQRATVFVENEKQGYRNTQPAGDPLQGIEQTRRLKSAGLEYYADLDQTLRVIAAYRSDDNDAFENASTYHIAARYLFTDDGSIHFSRGTGVTNPSFFEQFGFFPSFYEGNPNLEPEEQDGWDIGWEQQWLSGRLNTDITYFNLTLENEIATIFPLGQPATPINLTNDSDRQGVELSAAYALENGGQLSFAYTYLDANENDLPELRRPKRSGSIDFSLPFLSNQFYWHLGVLHNGTMEDTDFSTFTRSKLDAYTLVNSSLRYFVQQNIEVYLQLNNITDEEYQEVIGYNTPGFYGVVGLSIQL